MLADELTMRVSFTVGLSNVDTEEAHCGCMLDEFVVAINSMLYVAYLE